MGPPMGGAPQGGGFMQQAGMGGMTGAGPQKRNPVVMLVIPWGALVACNILAGVLGIWVLYNLAGLAYAVVIGLLLNKMAGELKSVTGDTEIAGWMMWIPGVNQIMCMIKVHPLMERARQMRGIQTPAKPNWMYLIIPTFALSSDLNDLA